MLHKKSLKISDFFLFVTVFVTVSIVHCAILSV